MRGCRRVSGGGYRGEAYLAGVAGKVMGNCRALGAGGGGAPALRVLARKQG